MEKKKRFEELVALMARLRGPDGCPWDREQTPLSLRTYLLEETYEVLDALERDDDRALRDELGDLLLQVVFHAQIAAEEGRFTIDDVLREVQDKLVRRHPHIFGEDRVTSAEAVRARWNELKAAERDSQGKEGSQEEPSALAGVARTLPALLEAYQLTRKASQVGFDWEKQLDVLEKLQEETEELRESVGRQEAEGIEEEVGDLLFVAVNVARRLGVDPEIALRRANRKFVDRFRGMERELARQGKNPQEATLAEMDALWERGKNKS